MRLPNPGCRFVGNMMKNTQIQMLGMPVSRFACPAHLFQCTREELHANCTRMESTLFSVGFTDRNAIIKQTRVARLQV